MKLRDNILKIIYEEVDDGGVGAVKATERIIIEFKEFVRKRKKSLWKRNAKEGFDKVSRNNELNNLINAIKRK